MRLFVALRLEPDLEAAVGQLQARLRQLDTADQVRWVAAHGMHLTLQFLGEVAEERLAALEAEIAAAVQGRPAPSLALGRPGGFPNLRRPRVLWIGLEEPGSRLLDLQAAVTGATRRLGWKPETREFQPHLTLGRVKEDLDLRRTWLSRPLLEAMVSIKVEGPPPGPQRRVSLMRSTLLPEGARYEALQDWSLEVAGDA